MEECFIEEGDAAMSSGWVEPRFSIGPLPLRKKLRGRAVFRGIAPPRFEWKRYSDNCTFGELLGVVAPPSKMQLAPSSRLAS